MVEKKIDLRPYSLEDLKAMRDRLIASNYHCFKKFGITVSLYPNLTLLNDITREAAMRNAPKGMFE